MVDEVSSMQSNLFETYVFLVFILGRAPDHHLVVQ